MKKLNYLILVLFAFFFGQPAHANSLIEVPLEKKVKSSVVIVVGQITYLKDMASAPGLGDQYAIVKVKAILKGQPEENLEIWTQTMVSEENVSYCSVGSDYVLFLRKTPDGRYISVNGRYGFVPIKP